MLFYDKPTMKEYKMKLRNIIGIAAVAALLPALAACSTGTETPAPAETSAVSTPVEETETATAAPAPTAAAVDPKAPGEIQGGVAALATLPLPSGVPEGWQSLTLQNLSIAIPSTFTVSPLATPDTLSYEDLVNKAAPDANEAEGVLSSPQIFSVQTVANSSWDGSWKNPEGAESFKLEIPGAAYAAAYCSEEGLGEVNVSILICRIEAKGQDSTNYVVDMYTQSGNMDLVKQIAGTMSIA